MEGGDLVLPSVNLAFHCGITEWCHLSESFGNRSFTIIEMSVHESVLGVHSTQLSMLLSDSVAIFSRQLLSKKYLMAYELSIQCVCKWEQWYQREKFDMASSLQIVGVYLA
jgi:hypothetical protein